MEFIIDEQLTKHRFSGPYQNQNNKFVSYYLSFYLSIYSQAARSGSRSDPSQVSKASCNKPQKQLQCSFFSETCFCISIFKTLSQDQLSFKQTLEINTCLIFLFCTQIVSLKGKFKPTLFNNLTICVFINLSICHFYTCIAPKPHGFFFVFKGREGRDSFSRKLNSIAMQAVNMH